MSILLQLLALAVVATGMAWAIVRDAQAVRIAIQAWGTAVTPPRWPWAAYGMLGVSGGLFLFSADMALFGLGWVEEQGGATAVIGLLLMVVPFGLWGLTILYALWGAVRCLAGDDFRYVVIGKWLDSGA